MKLSERLAETIELLKKEHSKNTDYRMQNYFNCVDDYSWGGICDQAQDQKMGQLERLYNTIIEQEKHNGYLVEVAYSFELQDLDGNVVSTRLVNGKFGLCFIIKKSEFDVQFVGASAKQSTFLKKGFQLVTKKYELKVIYMGTLNSKFANRKVELISLTDSIEDKINYSTGADTSLFVYQSN